MIGTIFHHDLRVRPGENSKVLFDIDNASALQKGIQLVHLFLNLLVLKRLRFALIPNDVPVHEVDFGEFYG